MQIKGCGLFTDIFLVHFVGDIVAMSYLFEELLYRTSDHRPFFQSDYKCGMRQTSSFIS